MHIQKHFAETRVPVLHELIRAWPLAAFVVVDGGEIVVNHMPMVIDPRDSEPGILKGHIPRANDIWKVLDGKQKAVAVFNGPQAYVTPSWYPSKAEHGKVVPTWNYVVAHAHGCPRPIEDTEWLLDHLHEMTSMQESVREHPWKISDAPASYMDKMVRNIIGIEMPISHLEGKWKVSQNRPEADRLAVAKGLRDRGDANSLAMAALVLGEGA
jgi:transcriptional regulator